MFLYSWGKKCNSHDWHKVVTHQCERVVRTGNSDRSATHLQTLWHHFMKNHHVTTKELNSLSSHSTGKGSPGAIHTPSQRTPFPNAITRTASAQYQWLSMPSSHMPYY